MVIVNWRPNRGQPEQITPAKGGAHLLLVHRRSEAAVDDDGSSGVAAALLSPCDPPSEAR